MGSAADLAASTAVGEEYIIKKTIFRLDYGLQIRQLKLKRGIKCLILKDSLGDKYLTKSAINPQ